MVSNRGGGMAGLDTNSQDIKRGDIWSADLRPGIGWEVTKKRPALIISNNVVNELSPTVIVIPFSSQYSTVLGPERIFVSKNDVNLAKDSVILVTQIRAVDKTRLIKKIGTIPKIKLQEIEEAIHIVLGIEEKHI